MVDLTGTALDQWSQGGDLGSVAQSAGVAKRAYESEQKVSTELMETLKKNQKQQESIVTGIEEARKRADAVKYEEPPKPPPPPEAPKPENPIQAFGSLASTLGIFLGAFSRQPLTASLGASAAAMHAYKENKIDDYNRAVEQWKSQNEYATKMAEWELNRYKAARDKYKDDLGAFAAEANIIAASSQNANMQRLIAAGMTGEALTFADDALKRLDMFKSKQGEWDAEAEKGRALLEFKNSDEGKRMLKDDPVTYAARIESITKGASATKAQWQVLSDPGKKDEHGNPVQYRYNVATGEATTLDMKPYEPMGAAKINSGAQPRSAPAMALQKFMQDHPNATEDDVTKFAADYASTVKAARDFGTGPLGNQTRSFNVGIYHLNTLRELGEALKNGDMRRFNDIANKFSSETGAAAPTNFATAKQIIGAEVVKAIVGAGGGGVQERLEAAQHIADSLSPEQLAGAIDTTEELMVGQLRGIKSQYERTTKRSDFEDTFLSPEVKEVFDRKTAGKGGDKGNLESQAKDAWGSYEPDKYDYRVNPKTGSVQRKPKDQQ